MNNGDFGCFARLLSQHNIEHCFSRLYYDIFVLAHVDFVLNFYIEVSASPCTKNVLRMFEAHLWKKNKNVEPR